MSVEHKLIRFSSFKYSLPAVLFLVWLSLAGQVQAGGLKVETRTQVSPEGAVEIELSMTNWGAEALYHLHPMLHFHHTMAHLSMIHELAPGDTVTISNSEHPKVIRIGTYPVVAMIQYSESPKKGSTFLTKVHTDSFSFKEPLISAVEGHIDVTDGQDASLLKIMLKNPSPAFKNVRLMLLLPPELKAQSFQGMKGFTLRAGEEKYFEVPVKMTEGMAGGTFPVHLMVEYGEMLKHYSGDIEGKVHLGSLFSKGPYWPQLLVFLFISVSLFMLIKNRRKQFLLSQTLSDPN